ncbi:MAG: hypothetical protein KDD44_04780 [Bdellovibrionales bacterium]|nr:hypothetical protein [Bdellovibrionales bacterium]
MQAEVIGALIGKAAPQVECSPEAVGRYVEELSRSLSATTQEGEASDLASLLSYPVPAMTADGCSRLDGSLEEAPFDLGAVLGLDGDPAAPAAQALVQLDSLVDRVARDLALDWLGIYQRRERPGGAALVKLVYRGIPSRAEFPLTKEFARRSNNSSVGLSGNAVIINDIEQYLWESGGPYYQCDSKVLSEACLPIFSADSEAVIGIVDAESWNRQAFTSETVSRLFGCAIVSSHLLQSID